ncbi:O-antigen ligase family protein [Providencia manganoxydans]|uniref:O-antigen ligase family protein n=1 Tax=Providencia manganoxydans TaxID=2923283 RepID=UPI0034E5A113
MIENRLQSSWAENILFTVLLSCIPVYILNPKYVEKIIYLIALFCFLGLLKKWRKLKFNPLAFAFFIFGASTLIWAYTQQGSSTEFLSTYRSYKDAGKLMLAIAIITLALDSFEFKIEIGFTWGYIVLLVCCGLAMLNYSGELFIDDRLSINMPATGTAYIFTFLSIAALSLPKLHLFIRLGIFFALLYLVVLTGTRAAILVMPALLAIFLVFEFKKIKNKKLILSFFLFTFIFIAFFSKDTIVKRTNSALSDLTNYSNNNSNSSIGARFAMNEIGLKTGNHHLLGQSLESRLSSMQELTKGKPTLQAALMFADVNLHSDFIDAYSIRGIPGAFIYLLLIGLLLYSAYREKNLYKFMFTLSTIAYGMSDMIFYGRNMMVIWGVCFIIITLCSYNKNMGYK